MKAGIFKAASFVRFLVAVVILAMILVVTPCRGQQRCSPLTIPFCQGLSYNSTILNPTMQQRVSRELSRFSPLMKIACSDDLAFFLCSMFAPICTLSQTPTLPCRSLCNSVRRDCEDPLKTIGFTWPEPLNCDNFPDRDGKDFCVVIPDKTTPQPPVTERAKGELSFVQF